MDSVDICKQGEADVTAKLNIQLPELNNACSGQFRDDNDAGLV